MNNRTRRNCNYITGCTYVVGLRKQIAGTAFYDAACYQHYLVHLLNSLNYFQISLHAYALLPDRIWLLLTPASQSGLAELLRETNASYEEYFCTRFDRTMAPWSDFSRLVLISADELALTCQKYIEREPLQLGLVKHPGNWQWSSYNSNAFCGKSQFLTRHSRFIEYAREGGNSFRRYRELVATPFAEAHYRYLQYHLKHGEVLPRLRLRGSSASAPPRRVTFSRRKMPECYKIRAFER